MRDIDKIIIHCSDTRVDQNFSIEDIRNWHTYPKKNVDGTWTYMRKKYQYEELPLKVKGRRGNGWSDVGYHYYIRLNGDVEEGRDVSIVGSHCKGQNTGSIGVCFEGGKKANHKMWDGPNEDQVKAYKKLDKDLQDKFGELSIHGHCDFSTKSCPNFDVCTLR